MGGIENQRQGKDFETHLGRVAKLQGLLVYKYPLGARQIGRRLQLVAGPMDYRLVRSDGRVAVIDCKSFQKDHLTYSQLKPHQIEESFNLQEFRVTSGFVVHFIPSGEVVYFSGRVVKEKGPGARFSIDDGVGLGKIGWFDLKKIFDVPVVPSAFASYLEMKANTNRR